MLLIFCIVLHSTAITDAGANSCAVCLYCHSTFHEHAKNFCPVAAAGTALGDKPANNEQFPTRCFSDVIRRSVVIAVLRKIVSRFDHLSGIPGLSSQVKRCLSADIFKFMVAAPGCCPRSLLYVKE